MAYKRLTEFLEKLEQSDELIRIKSPVSAELEITEITDRISKLPADKNKALLFEQVEGSQFPLVVNLYGNPRRMAWAMGVDDLEELNHRLAKLIDLKLPKGLGPMMSRGKDVFDTLRRIGLDVYPPTPPADFQRFLEAELPRWGAVIRNANIRPGA